MVFNLFHPLTAKIFVCNSHLAPKNLLHFLTWHQIIFSTSNHWHQVIFYSLLFRRLPTVLFYFVTKDLVICRSAVYRRAVYLFCRELNSLQKHLDSSNSTLDKNSWRHFLANKIPNKLPAKCFIKIFMSNLYSFCYILIYKCNLEYKKQ